MNKYADKQIKAMKQSFPKVSREPSKPRKLRKPTQKNIRNKKEVDAVKGGKTSW